MTENPQAPTASAHSASGSPASASPASAHPASPRPSSGRGGHPNRLTTAAGITILVIVALHTAFFAVHPWWGDWLAGPLRTHEPPMEASVQFWALPGGFVIPFALLGMLLIAWGRRGLPAPWYLGPALGLWALACVWTVGPSGFLFVLAPAVLLVVSAARARRMPHAPRAS